MFTLLPSFTDIMNTSITGMQTRFAGLDVVSNNLANINTTAYKSSRSNFQEILDATTKLEKGTILQSTQHNMKEGTFVESDSPLHLAIQGTGFFAVTMPDKTKAYTRDGTFSLDANRQIVTDKGYPLVWSGQIPNTAEKIEIDENGLVTVLQNGTWTNVGQIQLNKFPNPGGLIATGNNLFTASAASGVVQTANPGANNLGWILPRMKEVSNVNLGLEMTNAIITQRNFQLQLRTFQTTDTMLSQAIALRR
jgi:flagellar basal-body rod protein FlgG